MSRYSTRIVLLNCALAEYKGAFSWCDRSVTNSDARYKFLKIERQKGANYKFDSKGMRVAED